MRKSRAGVTTAVFFVVGPGTVVGLIPWLITRWEFREPLPYWMAAQAVGVLLLCAGIAPVAHAFVRFAEARGTPIPIAPTQHLVVSGPNRYIRNPMYVGMLAAIVGQALLFGRFSLLLYAVAAWAIPAAFVRWYEEPALARRFGPEYEAYQRAVPAWWPRLRPWNPGPANRHGAG